MAKLVRRTLLQFGSTVNAGSEIGQFGSFSSPVYSGDVGTMQSGTAWPRGWFAETIAVNRPFIQDINAVDFVYGYMLCYILQMGIAEYDAGTTYYQNSMLQVAGQIYTSLVDNNTGNIPATSPTQWQAGLPGAEISGVIKSYAGATAPSGYLLCNGAAVSRTTYAALFNVCGTAYGAGDGSTTFNIPDLRGKIPVAYLSGDANFGTIGASGGEASHTLSVNEIPSHSHQYQQGQYGNTTSGSPENNPNGRGYVTSNTTSTGGGLAHNNIQPYQTVGSFIIKT